MAEAIRVDNVTKNFTRRYQRTIKQITVAKVRRQQTSKTFQAIDDVSFTVQQGESIGLMGLNGSGKSTMLKMINGVMRPDEGSILVRGRIAGLIATGAGFHPQLSGRDNLVLNAAILGMTEKETRRKFDAIVDFAGIEKQLDQQVGHYSSGQSARLGFSIAIHVDSDIFLADEVLAVGDKPFRAKCMERMEAIRDGGRTLFYVSHSAGSVRRMCTRVLILDNGRLVYDGEPKAGIKLLGYDAGDLKENPIDLDEELGADI